MHDHQGQTTLPRLTALLQSVGLSISKRELQRLLTEKHDGFLAEARDVLRAGLETSPWISVDDTGARHKVANGFCTQIGNDRFTWLYPVIEEPAELSQPAARRPYRLRAERRSVQLHAHPRAARHP